MTITAFLMIFSILTVVTPLITQGVKAFLDSIKVKYILNVVVLVVASISGAGATIFYMLNEGIEINSTNLFYVIFMIIGNWLGSMLGYDKVKQCIVQSKKNKTNM